MVKIKYVVVITGIIFFGCNHQIKFNKVKWQQREDAGQPSSYRKDMLKDLITNYKLTGLKYSEIINLLGSPNFSDSLSLGYDIIIEYSDAIDPVYTKTLNFTFSKDSIITSFKVEEWKK